MAKKSRNDNPNEVSSLSQKQQIKNWLLQGKSLTFLQALGMFQCARLQARISELRDEGLNIETEMILTDNGKRIAKYYIKKENLQC